eukprot:TRINITY_DN6838_c0_g2_i1.p3 TRINITY_DN6838_c0_g2~~TRINITY_DN6838_c0_g2_i1.p3  ORF type:complete len:185 (-),score=48.13 TRINITY_DN6838_c0_g2_i1:92-646(-)
MCEIDEMVPTVSRRFLPTVATAFDDPRVTLLFQDASAFMDRPENHGRFDVIIVDSSDPIGPASVLFQRPFYENMARALREGGIVCSQGECMWLHGDLIREVMDDVRPAFTTVEYAFTAIPTYPSGQIGFLLCGKGRGGASAPAATPPPAMQAALRYYNPAVHAAAFALPEFCRRKLEGPKPQAK